MKGNRSHFQPAVLALLILAVAGALGAFGRMAAAEPTSISFARDVAPVLVKQCQSCHGPDKAKSKYRLDTFTRLKTPGKSKAMPIMAGEPDKSELFRLVSTTDDDDRMPRKADPLPASQVQIIKHWIQEGAKFDGPDPSAARSTRTRLPPIRARFRSRLFPLVLMETSWLSVAITKSPSGPLRMGNCSIASRACPSGSGDWHILPMESASQWRRESLGCLANCGSAIAMRTPPAKCSNASAT
jgi:mono/diheme cytochrome c family protein